jgi:hypothetical protein
MHFSHVLESSPALEDVEEGFPSRLSVFCISFCRLQRQFDAHQPRCDDEQAVGKLAAISDEAAD